MDWVPQNDVLGHPAVKAFVTHAGVNSLYEAAYHAKPIVAVPLIADQPSNAAQVNAHGCCACMHTECCQLVAAAYCLTGHGWYLTTAACQVMPIGHCMQRMDSAICQECAVRRNSLRSGMTLLLENIVCETCTFKPLIVAALKCSCEVTQALQLCSGVSFTE